MHLTYLADKFTVFLFSKSTNAYVLSSLRYSTTKLLEILFIRELVQRLNSPQTFKDHRTPSPLYSPVFTLPTPGLCYTAFFGHKGTPKKAVSHPISTAFHYLHLGMIYLMSRRPDVGARTTVTAACAGREADGEFMMDGKVTKVVGWVETEEGRRVQERVFKEILLLKLHEFEIWRDC